MPSKKTKKSFGETSKAVLEIEKPSNLKEILKTSVKPKKRSISTEKKTKVKKIDFKPDLYIIIDHPKNEEIISGEHYAIRLGASNGSSVEISFNGDPWQACRYAAGYWWYDWADFKTGSYKITARLKDEDGNTIIKSLLTKCKVI